jgi:hypothetical protein
MCVFMFKRVLNLQICTTNHFTHLSTGQPTYWPSDIHKIPDIVDFCVTKGFPPDFAVVQSCLDLSSDHSPVLVTLTSQALHQDPPPSLFTHRTNWNYFSHLIHRLTPHVPLKTTSDIEVAVKFFTDTVQWAGWKETPKSPTVNRIHGCPIIIKQKLAEKRKLRRDWQRLRTPVSKLLNAATQDLKQHLRKFRNDQVQTFLQGLQQSTPCGRRLNTLNASHDLPHR